MIDTPYVYPIWRTLNYAIDADADTLFYRIVTENEYYIPPVKETVHEGIASRRPEDEYIYINLNKPCAPHIDSKLIPSSLTGDTAEGMNAYRAFELQIKYNADDEWNPIHDFAFVNDWSYGEHLLSEEYDSGLFNFSEPINGKAAPGQILPQTWLAMSGGTDACYEIEEPPEPEKPFEEQYLTFEIATGEALYVYKAPVISYLAYSADNGKTWREITATRTQIVSYAPEPKILLKGRVFSSGLNFSGTTAAFNISGNIMSLSYGDNFIGKTYLPNPTFRLSNLFAGTKVSDASNLVLPATTLTQACYDSMFSGCTSLTAAPALPATTLAYGCYEYMFNGCSSLTAAPTLPATTLAEYCYYNMFNGCSSLTAAPTLPATTLERYCYSGMFQGCASLTEAPALPATTLAAHGCSYMFQGCASLTEAPALPATTLVEYCYRSMFYGCASLKRVACAATTWESNSTTDWLYGVSSTGTFTKAAAATWGRGNSGIPSGWLVKDYTD